MLSGFCVPLSAFLFSPFSCSCFLLTCVLLTAFCCLPSVFSFPGLGKAGSKVFPYGILKCTTAPPHAESGQGPVPAFARSVGPRVGGPPAADRPADPQFGALVGFEIEAEGVFAGGRASTRAGQLRGVQDVSAMFFWVCFFSRPG